MASLAHAIKTMLENNIANGTVPDANITYGNRNQNGTLPAISYKIISNETMTIGSAPLKKASVEVTVTAATAEEADDLGDDVEAAFVTGTYESIVFSAVLNMNSVLQEPTNGEGEENEPFLNITTTDIYYKE
jgi:hypothetical protein